MSWQPKIVLGDADASLRDTMLVEDCRTGGDDEVYICVEAADSDGGPAVASAIRLDKTTARELFNWLGVWLHRS